MSAPPLVILLVKLQFASLSLYNTCRPDIHYNLMVFSWDKFSKWPWKITQPHSSFFWLLVLWPSTPQSGSISSLSHCDYLSLLQQQIYHLTTQTWTWNSAKVMNVSRKKKAHEKLKWQSWWHPGWQNRKQTQWDYNSDDPWHWWNAQLRESCKHWRQFWITMNMSRQKTPDSWKREG
jgi:hypothetical protein